MPLPPVAIDTIEPPSDPGGDSHDVAVGRAILARDMALVRQFSTHATARIWLGDSEGDAGAALEVITSIKGPQQVTSRDVADAVPTKLPPWLMDVLAAAKPPQ
ncbi:hypothetical protein G7Z17_g6129 [Cylindrodendrum hubeiense]|uniref:Uncharacterized protein n=1 Tax=Cylindrodendrum hubeiense TaxID=595255 RepID=A0A9P5HAS6_9HYPO|nr:hypothetical protein G7Z17_g6129 [Cylindrodendrum hubeiense]